MNFGTWNTQGISGKTDEIAAEMEQHNIGIVTLTETKKKGQGTEKVGNYIHVFSGVPKHERAKRGVSMMIHKKYWRRMKDWEAIDENIIRLNVNIMQRELVIMGVYAISDDESVSRKDEFYNKLSAVIQRVGRSKEVILMGDFNSRTGNRKDDPVVGPFGEDRCNDNGERLIDCCRTYDLKIANGFCKHEPIHKFTWIQHTKNLKSIIDYIITRQHTELQVNDVRAYRGILCDSDHYFVRAKIFFPWHHDKSQTNHTQMEKVVNKSDGINNKRWNLSNLQDDNIKQRYQTRLDEYLTAIEDIDTV